MSAMPATTTTPTTTTDVTETDVTEDSMKRQAFAFTTASSPSISSTASSSGVSSDGEHSNAEDDVDEDDISSSSSSSSHRRQDSSCSSDQAITCDERQLSSSSCCPARVQVRKCYTFIAEGDFDIVWPNVGFFVVGHLMHFYSLYILFTSVWHDQRIVYTWFWSYWVGVMGGLGITAGAHRLWSHKSYDASLGLRIFLMVGQCIAGQNSLYVWCRDHRVHHKFSETDGDPHNTNRGFFFAHVGWLLRKKHPELKKRSSILDFSDLLSDPVVQFQKDYYPWLYLAFALFGPALIPPLVWGEPLLRSLLIVYVSRYITSLHATWFVNSTAHMFGDRPYNREIQPRENPWVSYGAFGEGYHNYHHTFPWDYATSELGCKVNVTKKFIDLMARLGLAYNLKVGSKFVVGSRKQKVLNELRNKSSVPVIQEVDLSHEEH